MSDKPEGSGGAAPIEEIRAAIARVRAANPQAATVLGVAAYLGPRRIPVVMLTARLTSEVQRKAAIDGLIREKLAASDPLDGGGVGITVPPAVQEEVRRQLEALGEDAKHIAVAAQLVANAYPPGLQAEEVRHWPLCERLGQHARTVLAYAPDDGDAAVVTSDLLHRLAHYLFARGRYEEAEPVVRRSGAIDELLHGPDHAQVGEDRSNLAILLYEMGRTEEALPHIRRAMAIGEAHLGPEHPIVAERYNILATMLESLGRPTEADPFIRHALLAAERNLGATHAETKLYRDNYERIVAAIDRIAARDDAVEAGLQPATPERLARRDLPPPPVAAERGVLGRLLKGRR